MNAIKRFFSILLVAAMFTAVTTTASATPLLPTSIQPIYVGVSTVAANLKISSAGNATVTAQVCASPGYTVDLVVSLERDSGVLIKSWSDSGSGTVGIEKTYYVSSGHDYYVSASVSVYDRNGKLVDSIVKESAVVTYWFCSLNVQSHIGRPTLNLGKETQTALRGGLFASLLLFSFLAIIQSPKWRRCEKSLGFLRLFLFFATLSEYSASSENKYSNKLPKVYTEYLCQRPPRLSMFPPTTTTITGGTMSYKRKEFWSEEKAKTLLRAKVAFSIKGHTNIDQFLPKRASMICKRQYISTFADCGTNKSTHMGMIANCRDAAINSLDLKLEGTPTKHYCWQSYIAKYP